MTKVTDNVANTKARNSFTEAIKAMLEQAKLAPVQVASHKVAFPFRNEAGNEFWAVVTVSIPKGSRDGEPYDGHAEAEDYVHRENEKIVKAEKAKAKREAKTKKS